MMTDPTPADPLWEPRYAVVGAITIVLAVLLLDLVPRMIRQRLRGTEGEE